MTIGGCPTCGQARGLHAPGCPYGFGAMTFTHPTNPEGVWAIVDLDQGESITKVFASEIDALRELNGRGYGRVLYVPFGSDLHDINTEEARLKKLRDQLSSGPTLPNLKEGSDA